MPFTLTDEGWKYDEKGKHRIPSKKDLFKGKRPPVIVYDSETGYPIKDGKIDWDQVNKETNNND